MLRIVTFILFIASFPGTVHSQPAGYKLITDEAAFRARLQSTSAATQTIRSNFIQEKNLNFISEKIISRGTFLFKKETRVRMEYTHPFRYLLIINQDKITIRDDQKTNSFSSKSNKLFTTINNIIIDCVQGTALENKDFKATVYSDDKSYLMIFKPVKKEMGEYFKSINVFLEIKTGYVYQIEMLEPSGDNTLITFTDRQINTSIPDAEFSAR